MPANLRILSFVSKCNQKVGATPFRAAVRRYKITVHRIYALFNLENCKNQKSFHILAENSRFWKSGIEYWLRRADSLENMESGP